MSVTSILILFCAITSFYSVGVAAKESAYKLLLQSASKGALGWSKNAFFNNECKERQPIVELWNLNELQYLFFSQRVTWEEAQMLCLNYNARLAVLDNMERAMDVARFIADSNIGMQDSWIGGRRVDFAWSWISEDVESDRKTEIAMEPNVEDFPPWTRVPSRPTKECLAVDRRSHDHPNFIDLDCRLQRPFICHKNCKGYFTVFLFVCELITGIFFWIFMPSNAAVYNMCSISICISSPESEVMIGSPVPSKWIQINRNTFTLYHAKVTWREAATFCRSQGARLAILKTSTVINILTNSMTKTRPDFEAIWIGAHFSYGQWVWMATGSTLSPLTDETGYPPWRFGRPEKNDGCLLLDRHIEDSTNFIEASCDRKRDFVCEEYPEDEDEDWRNEPVKFVHGNSTYIIYPVDKTWPASRSFCTERGSVLAHVGSLDTLNLIIEAMGDHPREMRHLWLGGQFRSKTDEWHWIDNDEIIPKKKDKLNFPPWARIDNGLDQDPGSSSCLNLDRSDHVKPHFYGLDCASKQPFVCKITCDIPPSVKHGSWKCYDVQDGKECSLQCDMGLIVMGVRNITCTVYGGWVTGRNWLEFPLCLEPKDYTNRMIRAVSHDMLKSAGYYILIDHQSPVMRSISLKFAERIVKAFPVSRHLQMGMTAYITNPPTCVSFNQTDNCEILKSINRMNTTVTNFGTARNNDISTFYNDVSKFNGRRILIIAIIDSRRASVYADSIDHFKSSGHHVTIIGLEEDWKMLLPLATVGFERRSNLFLFDVTELVKIMNQLDRMAQKPSKCGLENGALGMHTTATSASPPIIPQNPEEETQKEQIPEEEIPSEAPTKEETSKEEVPIEETPKEEPPNEELPKEEPPIEEPPQEEIPNEETPNVEVADAPEELAFRKLPGSQPGVYTLGNNTNIEGLHVSTTVSSEEVSKVSFDGKTNETEVSSSTEPAVKLEELMPRIYAEQTAKRDLNATKQESDDATIKPSEHSTDERQ